MPSCSPHSIFILAIYEETWQYFFIYFSNTYSIFILAKCEETWQYFLFIFQIRFFCFAHLSAGSGSNGICKVSQSVFYKGQNGLFVFVIYLWREVKLTKTLDSNVHANKEQKLIKYVIKTADSVQHSIKLTYLTYKFLCHYLTRSSFGNVRDSRHNSDATANGTGIYRENHFSTPPVTPTLQRDPFFYTICNND